ncbi:hypothetical protein AGLY_007246 [Aphis glycines]|uniref:Uncharacterized protein n=1 Tax=Aphis glycines TaxID=307491 RepID=A0A6G0TQ95_APHGL|nr:hypothetical protein AGLY_007246 [Aphis glycines]
MATGSGSAAATSYYNSDDHHHHHHQQQQQQQQQQQHNSSSSHHLQHHHNQYNVLHGQQQQQPPHHLHHQQRYQHSYSHNFEPPPPSVRHRTTTPPPNAVHRHPYWDTVVPPLPPSLYQRNAGGFNSAPYHHRSYHVSITYYNVYKVYCPFDIIRVLGPIYLIASILYTADLKTLKPTARAVSGHCGAIKS